MLLACATAFPSKGTLLPFRDTGGIVDSGKKWIPAFAGMTWEI
jgi:hypothetical protein